MRTEGPGCLCGLVLGMILLVWQRLWDAAGQYLQPACMRTRAGLQESAARESGYQGTACAVPGPRAQKAARPIAPD